MNLHKDIAFGWHLMHDRIFADVLPYQYSLDFEESFGALPTETDDLLRYVQFVKAQREHWRTNWWLKLQLNVFGFLRNMWLMLLMVNVSTLVAYTCLMAYFESTGMSFWLYLLFGIGGFVINHCILWLKESSSKHYAVSRIPVLVCAAGWAVLSMKDLIYLGFFSFSNLPTIVSMWIATMIGVKLTY